LRNARQRLAWLREHRFGRRGKTAMARALGMILQTYVRYEKDYDFPLDRLPALIEATRVHPKWLYTGQGEPFLPADMRLATDGTGISLINELIEREAGREALRGETPVREDAGGPSLPVMGAASAAGQHRIAYDPEQVTGREKWPRDPHLVRVEGDSMIPVALPGQFVICTFDRPESGDLAVIQLAEDGELLFKRIYWKGDEVQLISVNPDPKYPPVLVPKRAIRKIHKVWGVKF
jgi:phage repressor protein C with HTH and peptisase S24 domain